MQSPGIGFFLSNRTIIAVAVVFEPSVISQVGRSVANAWGVYDLASRRVGSPGAAAWERGLRAAPTGAAEFQTFAGDLAGSAYITALLA